MTFTVLCPFFPMVDDRGCQYYPRFTDSDVWCRWVVGVAATPYN